MTFAADTRCACDVREAVNCNERRAGIDMLVLHYTGMESGQGALDWLCVAESQVSCHYLVFEDGRIVQMVPERLRAWHAGLSGWRGHTDINSRSIGIEIVNAGHEFGYPGFPARQIRAVMELSSDIVARNPVPARNVVAHSDIAPQRKRDPGEKFPWRRLGEAGIGLWVPPSRRRKGQRLGAGDTGAAVRDFQERLALYGYPVEANGIFDGATEAATRAFQRHFRPGRIDGIADPSTSGTLDKLLALL